MGIGVPETGIPVPFSFFTCVGKVVTTGNIQVIYVDIVLYTASRAVSVFWWPLHTGDKGDFDNFVNFWLGRAFVVVLRLFCRMLSTVAGSFDFIEQVSNGNI